jgi:hypothetical protein
MKNRVRIFTAVTCEGEVGSGTLYIADEYKRVWLNDPDGCVMDDQSNKYHPLSICWSHRSSDSLPQRFATLQEEIFLLLSNANHHRIQDKSRILRILDLDTLLELYKYISFDEIIQKRKEVRSKTSEVMK